jgi:hypothetical protein
MPIYTNTSSYIDLNNDSKNDPARAVSFSPLRLAL